VTIRSTRAAIRLVLGWSSSALAAGLLVAVAVGGRAGAVPASMKVASVAAATPASTSALPPAASAVSADVAASIPGAAVPASTAPPWPPRAASVPAGVRLPPAPACAVAGDPSVPCEPLMLEHTPVVLAGAVQGRAYAGIIRAEGGRPPYRFSLLLGRLPAGLALASDGRIAGTAPQAGASRFRVQVTDDSGDVATQIYSLRVAAPGKSPAKPAAASGAASGQVAKLVRLDPSQADPPDPVVPTARVYQLEAAQLDPLQQRIGGDGGKAPTADPPTAAPPAASDAATAEGAAASSPDAQQNPDPPPANLLWSDAQHKQLEAILAPLFAVEYPTQSLFEAAVDARVCAQAWQLIVREAERNHQQPPTQDEFEQQCPAATAAPSPAATSSARSRPATAAPASAAAKAGAVAWRELPAWLMPAGLRDWLVKIAARDQPLVPTQPLPWTATPSCSCTAPRLDQPLYAIYPGWLADGPQPQQLDFSLINRITYLALPLDDQQALDEIGSWDEAKTAFIRTARKYETRVDIGIYNADWRFLATEPDAAREQIVLPLTTQWPLRARQLLDRPLPGLASRAKDWLPGFREVQTMGDGVTVFFDNLPDASREPLQATRFAEFFPRFVEGLARAMRGNPKRSYAINLMMTDRQMADKNGPFYVNRLFELLKAVEDPEIADGRIVAATISDYKRNANVELRFLVLLSEPTTRSKKSLSGDILGASAIHGIDRSIFQRSVVPLLLLPQASFQQYGDDLDYFKQNFGGVGFLPAPLIGRQFDARQQAEVRLDFGPDPGTRFGESLCNLVCPNRWLFRLLFELLLVACAVAWALLQWNCEWRSRFGRWALLAGLAPLLVGAALLHCDPALEALRKGDAQLIALIAIPLIATLWALRKRREARP
jgi:hypothetical protein